MITTAGTREGLRAALREATLFALLKLLLQFALTLWTTHLGYRYFRDEFYYIACGRHLAWGYVDHGPVVAIQARLGEWLFGDSVFALRILSAAAGALTVFLTGLLCWTLGGRRPAQVLAMLALLVCPEYIALDGFLSMNSFEAVFWMLCTLAVLQLASGASARIWWLVFGVSAGVGLLNKPSMTFFLAALALGVLLTPTRRIFFSRSFLAGVALMLLIVAPNLVWQVRHSWPTLEFLRNGRLGHKSVLLAPWQFFLTQVMNMHPLNALLWLPGVAALLRQRSVLASRWLGLTFILFFGLMLALHAKDYYLAPIYPAFFAAGGVLWEHRFRRSPTPATRSALALPVFEGLLVLSGLLILPMSSPVLSPDTWVRYTRDLHLRSNASETLASGPLPQFFADRFGWQEEVDAVLGAFRQLSPSDRQRVCLVGNNYGEAGALDFLGQRQAAAQQLTLPPALSGQNNYWLWGTHGCNPDLVLAVVQDTPEELATKYTSVQIVGTLNNPWSMPIEHKNVYLLRGRRPSVPFHWDDERFYF